MRKGPVWSLKRTLNEKDPAGTMPGADSSAYDSLEGVAPIDNAPAPNPATQQPKEPSVPAAVDDFFEERPQESVMDLPLDLWEGIVPGPPDQALTFAKAACILPTRIDQGQENHPPLVPVILGSLVLLGPSALQLQAPGRDPVDGVRLNDASAKRGERPNVSRKRR